MKARKRYPQRSGSRRFHRKAPSTGNGERVNGSSCAAPDEVLAMYVITFYSFRGGVGRTMSLVNIAAHLAQAGRRVLIVDFDLEAPGIRTYQSMGNPVGESNGLVDYIKKYLD